MVREEAPNIISQGESFAVEFKAEEKSPLSDYELYKAVVCLANGNGDLLLIGFEPDEFFPCHLLHGIAHVGILIERETKRQRRRPNIVAALPIPPL